MGTSGQNNYLGLNYQSWAALSVFLQHLRYSDLEEMHLEAAKMQDFDLYFKDVEKSYVRPRPVRRHSVRALLKVSLKILKRRKSSYQRTMSF